jgi:hypothetical protein
MWILSRKNTSGCTADTVHINSLILKRLLNFKANVPWSLSSFCCTETTLKTYVHIPPSPIKKHKMIVTGLEEAIRMEEGESRRIVHRRHRIDGLVNQDGGDGDWEWMKGMRST